MAKKPAKSTGPKSTGMNSALSETKLIRELAKILKDTDLSEIEMEKGDLRVRVARSPVAVATTQIMPVAAPAPIPTQAPVAAPVTNAPKSKPEDNPNAVKSPMVGTAYLRSNPDSDQFVSVGDSVKEGDTILLIEAMKTFNPIKAPKSGTVQEILVEDGQPVEFGEALMIIG